MRHSGTNNPHQEMRVLYVGKNGHDHDLIREALQQPQQSLQVAEVASAEECLSLLDEESFDIVLGNFTSLEEQGL